MITPWLHKILNDMTIVNPWQGSEYGSGSGYVRFLNILRYIIYATGSDIFKTLDHLEHFLFWHIKGYLGIFRHCCDILGMFVTVCNLGIFRTLVF